MNYERIYNEFIADRRTKQPVHPAYFEKHHIIPRSLGGLNGAENIVRLTAEDHIFAHLFLAKIHNNKSMWAAIKFIFGQISRTTKTPSRRLIRVAARAKEEFAKRNSGANNCNYGKPMTLAHKELLRLANTGRKQSQESIANKAKAMIGNSYSKGFKHTETTRLKISKSSTGRKHTEATKSKISKFHTGKIVSEATRQKQSDARMGKPRTWEMTQGTRDKMSAVHLGKIVSQETRDKQSKSRIGLLASESAKKKMSINRCGSGNPRAKQIICLTTGEQFGCVKDAADRFLIPQPSLRSSLNRNNGVSFIQGLEFRAL